MGLAAPARPATRSGDLVADIVADVVATTRRNTAVYSRNQFRAPWGLGIPSMHVASFQVVEVLGGGMRSLNLRADVTR